MRHYWPAIAVLCGLPLGLGAYTFYFGEGISYFSHNPEACANCHIMNDEFASWQSGPHHTAAVCVDCHLPDPLLPKLIAKADNGYRHSKGFTLQDFHEPIQIKPRSTAILQDNCVRCHGDFVHDIVGGSKRVSPENVSCIHCHRGVGHGARR